MGVYVRYLKKGDLDAFEPIVSIAQDEEFSPEMLRAMEGSGFAVTGIRNGEIFGCGGVHPQTDLEQGEIWLRLSKECLKHRLDTIIWLREALEVFEDAYPFRQLNVVIKYGYESCIKLAKILGFHETQTKTDKGEKRLIFSKRVKE